MRWERRIEVNWALRLSAKTEFLEVVEDNSALWFSACLEEETVDQEDVEVEDPGRASSRMVV